MLANGERVTKDSARIEAYGTVDELNAHLGHLRDMLTGTDAAFADLISMLGVVQNEMHDLGGELATPIGNLRTDQQQVIRKESILRLESDMDKFNETLKPLANFVLPGGHAANSQAHICRTVCRRAERCVVALARTEQVREEVIHYLNRLSDWLFVISRVISQRLNCEEVLWQQAHRTRPANP